MRIAVTGTPGTGKTTATERVETSLRVIDLNSVIEAEDLTTGVDEQRGSWVADLDAVAEWLAGREDMIIESHLAHLVDVDRVVVLRCRPDILESRLVERGESAAKARENAEAEALDVILVEAIEHHGSARVYEIDTTDRSPADVAGAIEEVLAGRRKPAVGTVSFIDYLDADPTTQ